MIAEKATTTGNAMEITRWSRLGEESFDDFFGKKLPYEGFSIEKCAHEYFIVLNQMNGLPSDHGVFSARELSEKG